MHDLFAKLDGTPSTDGDRPAVAVGASATAGGRRSSAIAELARIWQDITPNRPLPPALQMVRVTEAAAATMPTVTVDDAIAVAPTMSDASEAMLASPQTPQRLGAGAGAVVDRPFVSPSASISTDPSLSSRSSESTDADDVVQVSVELLELLAGCFKVLAKLADSSQSGGGGGDDTVLVLSDPVPPRARARK